MEEVERQLLRDPNIQPTNEVIAECLGDTYSVFIKFSEVLKEAEINLMEWRYYNDGKSWLTKGEYKWATQRGANKVKPIFWLSIWEGFFRVTFLFSESIQSKLDLPISQNTKELIKNAKPIGKTRRIIPLILNVKNDNQLNDAYIIAITRKEISN